MVVGTAVVDMAVALAVAEEEAVAAEETSESEADVQLYRVNANNKR